MSRAVQSYYHSNGYANNGANIAAGPARLMQFGGFNASGGQLWVQIFDATAVPADTTVPVQSFLVPNSASFSWEPWNGLRLTTGLTWSLSSTGDQLTATTGDVWVFARYIEES